jgi:glycerol dehydrogenase
MPQLFRRDRNLFLRFPTMALSPSTTVTTADSSTPILPILMAPARVLRGSGLLAFAAPELARLGSRPLIICGDRTRARVEADLLPVLHGDDHFEAATIADYGADCCDASLEAMQQQAIDAEVNFIIGMGGGKALDAAKLVAHRCHVPIATIPTSAATCAAWTALSNVYSDRGAFLYDVGLDRCPDLLLLDYDLIATAPISTLVSGIGDALAKWYEASISSGQSEQTIVVAAVQQARVLRDLLFQKSAEAIANPGGEAWREVVDASVLLAGVIGGLGGAQCRTVAAHAVHNGLTHIDPEHRTIHGEKVAYGILVQLRLEELIQGSQLAATARQQLLGFYRELGLPCSLDDLKLSDRSLADLQRAADLACAPGSDIHHLPFAIAPSDLIGAMVSTTASVAQSVTAG